LTERFGHIDSLFGHLYRLTEPFGQWISRQRRLQVERAMYREQDKATAATAAKLPPAVLENHPDSPPLQNDAASSATGAGADVNPAKRLRSLRPASIKRTMIVAAIAGALAVGGVAGVHWWVSGRYMVSTDDAYVRAHNTTLASKISGYVASFPIEDNAPIRAGDVIATIDDGDYKLAADAAREKVATEQATVDRIGRQVVAQAANVEQAKAEMASAQAGAKKTQLEFERQKFLAAQTYASQQQLEQAEANRDQGVAAVQSAQAVIDAAAANLDVLKAQQQEAARTLDELATAVAKAERDLSFTVIRAPVDGVFSNRAVETGDYVQTGQRIASLVPLDDVYIEANFKETQLARLRPGQPVSISVDAVPEHAIAGRVASLSPASGAIFSLLPPDNATGNFTKIVQRLPVRIEVPSGIAAQRVLRPGMSVVVSVDTKPGKTADGTKTAQAGEPKDSMTLR
jgi:membrane fusion protein (multidrug efflux system)